MTSHRENRLRLQGHWAITVTRRGKERLQLGGYNLVVDLGLEEFAKKVADEASVDMTHMVLGDGDAGLDGSQTGLGGSELSARVALASKSSLDNSVVLTCQITYPNAGPDTVREVGIFSDITAGIMFARWLTQEFSIMLNDVIDITWTLPVEG